MSTTLDWCRRSGHNPVLTQFADAFACSHGCGTRWARPDVHTCALPPAWLAPHQN